MSIKCKYKSKNVHAGGCLPDGGCLKCLYSSPFAQQQMSGIFMQQCICPMVDFRNVYTVVLLPSSRFWECLDSGLFGQWQISICFLLPVCNILYSGARGVWIQ